jgi:recombination protein RecT
MTPNPQTAVAKKPAQPVTIKSLINSDAFRQQVEKALPKHLTPDRFIRVATTTVMRTPKLAQCDQASFVNALLTLSQLGLEPDGRRAHLIPFENRKRKTVECQLIVDWKGLAELVLRSGVIAKLHADLICENDDFEYDMGEVVRHKIDFRKPRGERYAVYAMAQTKTGEKFVQVLSRFEVESVRDGSQGWKAFKEGYASQSPWDPESPVSEGEMWKKTAFRRLSKWLPLSPEIRDAVEIDDEPIEVTSTVRPASSLVAVADITDAPESEPEDSVPMGDEPKQPTPEDPPTMAETPQVTLHRIVTEAGFTFTQLQVWGAETGNIEQADSLAGFRDVPTDTAVRLLKSKAGLLKGLAMVKEAGR